MTRCVRDSHRHASKLLQTYEQGPIEKNKNSMKYSLIAHRNIVGCTTLDLKITCDMLLSDNKTKTRYVTIICVHEEF